MADIDVNYYDYNGSLYAFGVIMGYSTVGSVRMYVSDGHGNTKQYLSTMVYTSSKANLNSSVYPNGNFFCIRTDLHTETGDDKQLSYNVIDPDDSSGRGRYKVGFHFYSSDDGTGSPLNSSVLYASANGYSNIWYQMHNSMSTPSASFNEETNILTVTGVGSNRCNLRITRKNRINNPDFPPEVRDYAYKINMQSMEGTMGGKYTENYPGWQQDYNTDDDIECKYQRGGIDYSWYGEDYPTMVRVLFDSGANYSQSTINSYMSIVQDAFNEISEYTGLIFDISHEVWDGYVGKTNSEADDYIVRDYDVDDVGYLMYVRIGNDSTMGDLDTSYNGYWSFFTWSNWRNSRDSSLLKYYANHSTSIAHINTTRSSRSETTSHVIHEEIYQSLNIGIDCFDYPLSIHYDPHFPNPETYDLPDKHNNNISWDKEALKFFYAYNLAGKTPIELINEYDTPCCLVNNETSSTRIFDLSALKNDTYKVEVWVCAQGTNNPGGGTWSSKGMTMGGVVGTSHYNWDGGWDDAPYSIHEEIDITIKSTKPDKWVWSSRISADTTLPCDANGIHPVSATEWNNFTARVNEFRDYAGYGSYNFTTVSSKTPFSTAIYNEAVAAIKGVSGYGSYVYYVDDTTIMIQNSKFRRTLFDSLASEANAIAGYT